MKKLKIVSIVDKKDGIPENEFIMLKATKDVNLGEYAIVDNTFTIKPTTTKIVLSDVYRHVYFFPNTEVKKGNYVVLYSGKTKKNKLYHHKKKDVMVHIFYWNSKKCIWNDTGDEAILIKYKLQESYFKK